MSLELRGISKLPLISPFESGQRFSSIIMTDSDDDISDEGYSTVAVRALPPEPSKQNSREEKWYGVVPSSAPLNKNLAEHLKTTNFSQGYKFHVYTSRTTISDAIGYFVSLDKSFAHTNVKDGKSLRDHAVKYMTENKAEVNGVIADQLWSIAQRLKKNVYLDEDNKIAVSGEFDAIVERLPGEVSLTLRLHAINSARAFFAKKYDSVAKIDATFNQYLNDKVLSDYKDAITSSDPSAQELFFWILNQSLHRSISIWSQHGLAFEENHYCRKGIDTDETIHLVQMSDGYGVLLP